MRSNDSSTPAQSDIARLFDDCCARLEAGDPGANDLLEQINAHTDYAPGWIRIGHTLFRLGRYAAAVVALDTALAATPGEISALLWKAECLMALEHFDAAEAVLAPWQADTTRPGAIAHSRGRIAYAAGHLETACELLELAVDAEPEVASAWFQAGLAYHDRHCYDTAARHYARALQCAPDLFEAALNRGHCLQAARHIDAAMEAYARAYAAEPGCLSRIAHALTSESTGRLWLNLDALAQQLRRVAG